MDIKLIAIDMDGTLLYSRNEITPRVKESVLAAAQKGVKIVISTGRIYSSARQYTRILGVETPIISCNGALIRKDDENLYKCSIPRNALEEAANLLVDYDDIYYRMYGDDSYYSKKENKTVREFMNWNENQKMEEQIKVKIVSNPLEIYHEGEDILKMFIVQDETRQDRYDELIVRLSKIEGVYCVSSMAKSMDVINKNVNKGNALEHLAKRYNITSENIMAIGDNYNDLEMIRFAGIGVAMGNADEEVKKEADFVTKTNLEDGVAVAIEKYVL